MKAFAFTKPHDFCVSTIVEQIFAKNLIVNHSMSTCLCTTLKIGTLLGDSTFFYQSVQITIHDACHEKIDLFEVQKIDNL